jgi:UDP-4-amino-4,6-dideoxy-N-acetyl-beta-L-altrosamine N-acetyltransferase
MIAKDITYKKGELKFVNFIVLSEELKIEILKWRNDERIKKWMFNKNEIALNDHLNFIKKLSNDNQKFYWLVYKRDQPIGVVNINNYNIADKSIEWGFYLNPSLFMSNLGFELFYETINLFFEEFSLNELEGYVQEDNKSASILNSFFGMKYIETVSRDNNIYSFRKMTLDEWMNSKTTLKDARKKFVQYILSNKSING